MSALDELRALCDRLTDEKIDAYEAGFQDGLKAVLENVISRKNNNPKLTHLSVDSIIAIVHSEERPLPWEKP